jgi:hypothetical protein
VPTVEPPRQVVVEAPVFEVPYVAPPRQVEVEAPVVEVPYVALPRQVEVEAPAVEMPEVDPLRRSRSRTPSDGGLRMYVTDPWRDRLEVLLKQKLMDARGELVEAMVVVSEIQARIAGYVQTLSNICDD